MYAGAARCSCEPLGEDEGEEFGDVEGLDGYEQELEGAETHVPIEDALNEEVILFITEAPKG